jgi:soluble lytic murein transglycosylase-like protein
VGALRSLAAALALVAAAPAHADALARWQSYIAEASARFGIPAPWIERVIRAESAGQTTLDGRPITSRAGAMGLMQLMPATWAQMRAALRLGSNPHHPRDNILAGAYYLRLMYDRFGYPGMFAAYNAGPARYADHLATGRRLARETRAYVVTVAGRSSALAAPARRPATGIFFVVNAASQPRTSPRSEQPPLSEPPGSLFVPLQRGGASE